MSATIIHLLQFKILSHLKKGTLNASTQEHIPKKKHQISLTLHLFAILCFSHQYALVKLPSWTQLESTSLDETINYASRCFILAQRRQNLEFVNLKCITYTTHLDALKKVLKTLWCRTQILSLTIFATVFHANKSLMLLSDKFAARRIAPLMVIFVQLRKCHLLQREGQAVSSVKPIDTPPLCPKWQIADSWLCDQW